MPDLFVETLSGATGFRYQRADAFVDVDPKKIGRRSPGGVPVRPPEALREDAALRGVPILAAVGALGARTLIRSRLAAWGYTEGEGFFCAA